MLDNMELMKLLSSFAILVVMLYGVYYYLNRLNKNFSIQGKDIQILEKRIIGKNQSLCLAKIKDTVMLFSCDDKGIKLLKEWKDEGA